MIDNTVELQLDSRWWVRCRPVPPLAPDGVRNKAEFWYPPPPTIKVKTQKGRAEEERAAPTSSPEAQEYFRLCREIDESRDRAGRVFAYEYGITAWSEDRDEWLTDPPEGWELDKLILDTLGEDVKPKIAFIMYDLILTNGDLIAINRVLYSMDSRSLEGGEVQAAEDGFQDRVEGRTSEIEEDQG